MYIYGKLLKIYSYPKGGNTRLSTITASLARRTKQMLVKVDEDREISYQVISDWLEERKDKEDRMIKVLLADGQRIMCEGIKHILEEDTEINVVGYALNAEGILKLCDKYLPDVLLMDIALPGTDVIGTTSKIRAKLKSLKIIILTTSTECEKVLLALNCGAHGYILKDVEAEDLIVAVRGVSKGLNVMNQEAITSVKHYVSERYIPPYAEGIHAKLTDREKNIIRIVVEGKENREIAKTLFMSEGTVKNTLTVILRKLNVKTRIQLVVFAVRNQLA